MRSFRLKPSAVLLLSAFVGPVVQAQSNTAAKASATSVAATQPKVAQLAPIEVNAAHIQRTIMQSPTSIYEVVKNPDAMSTNINLDEVLRGVPGLQVNNRENYAQDAQLSIHGFGARSTFGVRGIRLYVDGIPATMPDGQGQTSNIDLSSLESMQVITGPFSSLYGNSSGGTILANTRTGEGRPSISLQGTTGSKKRQQGNVLLQGGGQVGTWMPDYTLSSNYFHTNGYRDRTRTDKNLNNAKLHWQLHDGSDINWIFNDVHINAQDPGGITREDWEDDPRKQHEGLQQYKGRKVLKQTQTGLTWNKPLNEHNDLYAMAYFGRRHVLQFLTIPQAPQKKPAHAGGVVDFTRHYYGADLRWFNHDSLPGVSSTVGLAFDRMTENRHGYENFVMQGKQPKYGTKGNMRRDETNTLWNLDPYVQASWEFLPGVFADTGLRYSNIHFKTDDHYVHPGNGDDSGKSSYDRWLPSVALGWQALDQLYVYGSYSKGFETPTFTESAYRADDKSGFNTDLQPSRSDNYEIGLKSDNQLGRFTAAFFYITTKDDIVAGVNAGGRSTFRNADKTRRKGVDLAWEKYLWQDLRLGASYSFVSASFASDIPALEKRPMVNAGNRIPGVAKHQAYASIDWAPEQGLQATLDATYKDKIQVDDINSDHAPSYLVAGAGLGYIWKHEDWQFNAFARVDNLFNRKYIGSVIVNDGNGRFFEPANKRTANVGLKITKTF